MIVILIENEMPLPYSTYYISANKLIDYSIEDMLQHQFHSDSVVAEIRHSNGEPTLFRMSDIPVYEKLEKFIEDVRCVDVLSALI